MRYLPNSDKKLMHHGIMTCISASNTSNICSTSAQLIYLISANPIMFMYFPINDILYIVNAQSFWEVLPHIIRYQLSIYDMRYLRYLLKHFLAFPYSNQISFQMPLSTIPSANNRYLYLLLWVLLRYLSHFVWYLGLKSYPRWVIIIYLQECYQSTAKCPVASSRK